MNAKTRHWNTAAALLVLLLAVGCSKQSSDSSSTAADAEALPVANKKMTSEIDKMCEEILQSPDKMDAREWIKRYPKSVVGKEEETKKSLATVATRFYEAGSPRVIVQYTKIGQGVFLTAIVVELPTDASARQKCFAMEPELSQLCDQTAVTDKGQKYLHYGFD
jgi:hypothetical protein